MVAGAESVTGPRRFGWGDPVISARLATLATTPRNPLKERISETYQNENDTLEESIYILTSTTVGIERGSVEEIALATLGGLVLSAIVILRLPRFFCPLPFVVRQISRCIRLGA